MTERRKGDGMSKSRAFITGLAVICLFGVANFFKADFPAPHYLTAVVALVTGYFALQVANNGVKGKFWNHELYHHENGDDDGKDTGGNE